MQDRVHKVEQLEPGMARLTLRVRQCSTGSINCKKNPFIELQAGERKRYKKGDSTNGTHGTT